MVKINLYDISPEELSILITRSLKEELKNLKSDSADYTRSEKAFLTRAETAKFFSVTNVTIHDWVKKGLITPYKLGNRTYFKYSELQDKLLESNSCD